MQDLQLKVKDPNGLIRTVHSIANNRDHVGNRIAEGDLDESQRYDETCRLYEAQLQSAHSRNSKLSLQVAELTKALEGYGGQK